VRLQNCIPDATIDATPSEAAWKMADPSYLNGLPEDHHFRGNDNYSTPW
jgi:hypothetical protein